MFIKNEPFLPRGQAHSLARLESREAADLTVLTLLADGARSTIEIAEMGALNPIRVGFALRRLRTVGLIRPDVDEKRPGRRLWRLSEVGIDAVAELDLMAMAA